MKQPLKLYQLSFIEIWNLFTYFGLQAILVLYLTQHLNFSDAHAYTIYGTYTALAYMLPVLGGIVADHYLNKDKTLLFGLITMIVGNILLFSNTDHTFSGVALLVIGIGLVKPSNAALVGALYHNDKNNAKESGFSVFYICMNMGAILAPIVYGFLAVYMGWRFGFACSVVFLTASLIVAACATKPKLATLSKKQCFILVLLLLVSIVIYFSIKIHDVFIFVLIAILIGITLKLVTIFKQININQKSRLVILLLLNVLSISYFAGSVQLGSSLMLFINRYVNTTMFGFHIPAAAFPAIQPTFVILTMPFFNWVWSRLTNRQPLTITITRIALGLLFGGISFICFAGSVQLSQLPYFNYALVLIIIANLFLAAGETCIAPALLSSITYLAPKKFQAMFMGMWYLVMGLAAYLGSVITKFKFVSGSPISLIAYRDNFLATSSIQLCCFITLLLMIKILFRLYKKV